MRVLISGATGLIGSALSRALSDAGHVPVPLSRSVAAGGATWDPASGRLDDGALSGCEAVVHLAGRSLLTRWTASAREEIRTSRVAGARLLAESIARSSARPRVFVSASAVGYYGDRGAAVLDETNGPGAGFLAKLAVDWEAATGPAVEAGVRVVTPRIAPVLPSLVGPLRLPFLMGLGARLGDGRQWMSWVALGDLVRAIMHVLIHDDVTGPVNVCAPEPVTNATFTRTLARVLRRPALFVAPAFVLRLLLGRDLADEALLASQRVVPRRLERAGFGFDAPRLEPALQALVRGGARS